ncbi:MAG: class I SAM-dependent methyltransferase [Phycisphaerales bacterium]
MVGPESPQSTDTSPQSSAGSPDDAHAPQETPGPVRDVDLSPIGRTLLITLWARAAESRRPDAIRVDRSAERLLGRIDHDFDRYRGGWKSQIGVAVRGRCLDRAVDAFVADHPGGLIVDLGCGLDGRPREAAGSSDRSRVDWLMVDRPDVLAVRRRLMPPLPHETLFAGDAAGPEWMERARAFGDRPRLLIAEGVLMFLPEADVRRMWSSIADQLPGTEGIFDVIGRLMIRVPALHDTLPATGVRFAWGWRGRADLDRWDPRARVTEVRPMVGEGGARWKWMRALRWVPPIRDQFVVLRVSFGDRPDLAAGHGAAGRATATADRPPAM